MTSDNPTLSFMTLDQHDEVVAALGDYVALLDSIIAQVNAMNLDGTGLLNVAYMPDGTTKMSDVRDRIADLIERM